MVILQRVKAYRVKVPGLDSEKFYEIRTDINDITLASFVERMKLSNRLIVVYPVGMDGRITEYLERRDYNYLPADVQVRAHVSRR